MRAVHPRWSGVARATYVACALFAATFVVALWAVERAVEARIAAIAVPEPSREVMDRDGRLLLALAAPDGRWRLPVTPDDVDRRYLEMLLAWEDRRFRGHRGIDLRAVLRAGAQALRHGRLVSGASTLSMQSARLVARLPARSWPAKREQALVALALERTRTKRDILSIYLTLAPFGGNLEGVRAASLAWFGKEPRRLTAAEAALLVALPQAPEGARPDRHPARATRHRDRVLMRAHALNLIDGGTLARALATPVPRRRLPLPDLAPHAARRVAAERPEAQRLHLTLDAVLQGRLEDLARERAAGMGRHQSLAVVVADAATGELRASVGGPSLTNLARAGYVDLTRAVRSPGSALKPFIYGLAFELGLAHPDSMMHDAPSSFAGYRPGNFDFAYRGAIPARRALQLSRNLPAVELLGMVGPNRFVKRLEGAGADLHLETAPGLAVGLGGVGVTLVDMVALYGAFARDGTVLPLTLTPRDRPAPQRLLSSVAAWYVASALSGDRVTVRRPQGAFAWKTGTSYGYRDAWALGFDGAHVVGVWVGRPDGAPVPGITGQGTAVPVLREAFARLDARRPLPTAPLSARLAGTLPPALQRIGRAREGLDRGDTPQIVFPPAGTEVELVGSALPLKVERGRPPFTWFVDGAPVAISTHERLSLAKLSGAGFFAISVVDATGRAARVRVLAR